MAQESLKDAELSRATKLSCLPKDVRNDEVVSYGVNGKQNVTVEKKLGDLKTRCRRGSLAPKKCKAPGNIRMTGNQLLLWRAKPAAILARIDKDEDHVTQVTGIGVQGGHVVLVTDSIRIASQECEVLNRHRSFG